MGGVTGGPVTLATELAPLWDVLSSRVEAGVHCERRRKLQSTRVFSAAVQHENPTKPHFKGRTFPNTTNELKTTLT